MNSKDNISEYIKHRTKEQQAQSRERTLHNTIPVIIQDFPPPEVNIDNVLSQLEQQLPPWFFSEVDVVYIGGFDVFIEKQVEAVYEDGAIYVFNEQPTEEDFVESIGHEVAHALEEFATNDLYGDGAIEAEFLGKRRRLHDILAAEGYMFDKQAYESVEYSEVFDAFLYQEVGYPVLTSLTGGLFMSPYAATSLREYFANGFEWFFLKKS